jgi:hypothetical protein
LLLEQIPTPKEFRDAIESLSPEQQRFAKAFRSMQLESTLFGVCVIQIKPQLEKLLGIPDDSLTKEIKLTQDLLSLFIEYQIPSDLLSYDGPRESSVDVKIARVKELVKEMKDMIQRERDEEIAEAKRQQEMRRRQEEEERRRREEEERRRRELQEQERTRMVSQSRMSSMDAPTFAASKQKAFTPISMLSRKAMAAPQSLAPSRPSASISAPPPPPSVSAAPPSPAPVAAAAAPPPPAPVAAAAAAPSQPVLPTPPSTPSTVVEASPESSKHPDKTVVPIEEVGKGEEDIDYTKIPAILDAKYEALDEDSALRPTIINVGPSWSKKYQESLLSSAEEKSLGVKALTGEKNKAFDLLDALSRSGSLPIDQATLHIVIASTHCFDKSLLDTVIEDNVNPIEKVERSSLIVATTIHNRPVEELVRAEQQGRVREFSPILFHN